MLGGLALLAWTIEAVLVSGLERLPTFQILTLVFGTSFLLTAAKLTAQKRWHVIKNQPYYIWLIGIIGVCGSDVTYIWAFEYAPAAHIDLLDDIWPFLVIIFSSIFAKERVKLSHIVGAALGLFGIYILITQGKGFAFMNRAYLPGYLLGIIGPILWGGYTVISRYFKKVPPEMIGIYCLIAMGGSLICHVTFEQWVQPTLEEGSLALFLGLTGAGLAYQCWDYAAKFGDITWLSVLAYGSPIVATGLLVLTGYAENTVSLWVASTLVTVGVLIGSVPWEKFQWLAGLTQPFLRPKLER